MQPINPSKLQLTNPANLARWAQSVFQCLKSGISLAAGNTTDSNDVYTTFNTDNGDGIMFRIGAAGSGLTNEWDSGTSQVVLNHALMRLPIGFIVCDLDGNAVIWRAAESTTDVMTLQISDTTVNATVYIF